MFIKDIIQKYLYNKALSYYKETVLGHSDIYRQWYLANEDYKKDRSGYSDTGDDFVVFADKGGDFEPCGKREFGRLFRENPGVLLAYADEDIIDETGRRHSPWFKPCFSPDTLASFNYYGHAFAIKRELLEKYPRKEWEGFIEDTSSEDCYRFLLKITRDIFSDTRLNYYAKGPAQIAPVGKVLIHMRGGGCEQNDVINSGLPDIQGRYEDNILYLLNHKNTTKDISQISIIIPSKDNPDVLDKCISSVRKYNSEPEIIIIDNGSDDTNRKKYEGLSEKYNCTYIYEKMDFNFSVMCNLGAGKSKGEYLLFLNDDMEVIEGDWLSKLLFAAGLPHVGSVGAKLLYPGTDLIQHAGVTNIKAGPVHKLQKLSDSDWHYHGQNRHINDMVGVTAACLLMKRSVFEAVGGYKETIAVSYNDVELSFSILEQGLFNVYRGDVTLYHHESLSRGDDNLSDDKWQRLLEEKDRLYSYHPALKSYDPFYSPNLAVHSNFYIANFVYNFEIRDYFSELRSYKGKDPHIWQHEALEVNVEHARAERRLETTEREDVYWIEGWSYILNNDNARYKRYLVLFSESGKMFRLEVQDRYRDDVVEVLPGQQNVELAGFVARFPYHLLTEREYRIGMVAADRCSRQRLFRMSEKKLVITQNTN